MATPQTMDPLVSEDDVAFNYKRAYYRVSAQLDDEKRVHGVALGRAAQRAMGLETQLQQARAEVEVSRAELREAALCTRPCETVCCRLSVVLKQLQQQHGHQEQEQQPVVQTPEQLSLHDAVEDITALETELIETKRELERVQDLLDEYTASSAAVEEELEQELARSSDRNAQLQKKIHALESEVETLREKTVACHAELSKCTSERDSLRVQLVRLAEITRRLEQTQDDLETRVRVLEATEADLRHELECEREEKVFLSSDHEELTLEMEELKERHRVELEELKSELFAAQQKLEPKQKELSTEICACPSGDGADECESVASMDTVESMIDCVEEEEQRSSVVEDRVEIVKAKAKSVSVPEPDNKPHPKKTASEPNCISLWRPTNRAKVAQSQRLASASMPADAFAQSKGVAISREGSRQRGLSGQHDESEFRAASPPRTFSLRDGPSLIALYW